MYPSLQLLPWCKNITVKSNVDLISGTSICEEVRLIWKGTLHNKKAMQIYSLKMISKIQIFVLFIRPSNQSAKSKQSPKQTGQNRTHDHCFLRPKSHTLQVGEFRMLQPQQQGRVNALTYQKELNILENFINWLPMCWVESREDSNTLKNQFQIMVDISTIISWILLKIPWKALMRR